jgi:hypothetical protein
MSRNRSGIPAVLLLAPLLAFGCADAGRDASDILAPQLSTTFGAVLVQCPTNQALSARGTVGALGGEISLNGHRVVFPPGAVLLPTEFELAVPVSNYMEIAVRAVGRDGYEFVLEPVSITISYARCTRSNIEKGPLTAWHIDRSTKALLADMDGVDDKEARTVTFSTDHLSGYALAE